MSRRALAFGLLMQAGQQKDTQHDCVVETGGNILEILIFRHSTNGSDEHERNDQAPR